MGLFSRSRDSFASSLLHSLPFGVAIYRLDDECDAASLRLVYANEASKTLTGLDPQSEVGRTIAEITPGALTTPLPAAYASVVTSGEPADLGTVTYGDERIATATYSVQAIPLDDRMVGVVFEDVSDRAEVSALRDSREESARAEVRYRSLVEATAAIVWSTPPDGTFVEDQPGWRAFTGQTTEELLGAGWLDAVHPDDQVRTLEVWEAAVEARQPYHVEHRLQTADGGYRHMTVRATPVLTPEGEVAEWVGVHTDVHEQHEAALALAASEAQFRTLFEALTDAVFVYPITPDGPGPILAFNQAALDRYGYSADELAAMTIQDIVVPESVDIADAITLLRETRRATFESEHRRRDGHAFPVETNARIVEYDNRLCVLAVCRDDEERRRFQREVLRANIRLERTVEERTHALEAYAEDLQILHRIGTATLSSGVDRTNAFLEAGCEMFDMPIGILSETPEPGPGEERLYRIAAVVTPDPEIHAGLEVPLREAFCDQVIESGGTVVYADAHQEAPDHPACKDRGLRAFIGAPIRVNGEVVGTVNFVSPEPRREGFSESEKSLIELMAAAIGHQLAIDRADAESLRLLTWYRTVSETADAAILVVGEDGKVHACNDAARDVLGVQRGDLVSSLPRTSVQSATNEQPEQCALREGRRVHSVLQRVDLEEGTLWFNVSAAPMDEDADGAPDSAMVVFHDVTVLQNQMARAERTSGLLSAILTNAPDGVMAFRAIRDASGEIEDFEWLLVNPRAEEIVGRSAESLIGRRLLEVFPGNVESGFFDGYRQTVESGTRFETSLPYRWDGFETTFRVTAVPLPLEDGFTVTFADTGTPA